MTTPRLGAPELVASQAVPETTVNEIVRFVEQGSSFWIVKDKDLATPPGSPADGDAYIVAGSPTGAWTGWAGRLAFYMSTEWKSVAVIEGFFAWVQDENLLYYASAANTWGTFGTGGGYTDEQARDAIGAALVAGANVSIAVNDGADTITIDVPNEGIDDRVAALLAAGTGITLTYDDAGNTLTIKASGVAPSTQSGTTYTAVLGDAGGFIQFTNAAAVTFTIPPNASVAFPTGTIIIIEQNGAGAVTFDPGAGVTLNSRGALLTTAGQYAVAQVKKVATNIWTVIGDVA